MILEISQQVGLPAAQLVFVQTRYTTTKYQYINETTSDDRLDETAKGMAEPTVSMKLLIDTRRNRVVFAEAGKDCVDFLFNILSLPVSTIIRLLKEEGMQGSLPNLYTSLENLDDDCIQPNKKKDFYLKPVSASLLPQLALKDVSTRNISCQARHRILEQGFQRIPENVQVVSRNAGLVKGVVTYMVMDDLEIKPMSTISGIALLNNVNYMGALKEVVVHLGMKEAIKLLKISLLSENVLTELFC